MSTYEELQLITSIALLVVAILTYVLQKGPLDLFLTCLAT